MKDYMVELELDPELLELFEENLEEAGNAARQGAWDGIEHLSDLVYGRAWASCPVQTGALRNSMYKEVEVLRDSITAHVGHGGKYNKVNLVTGKMTDSYAIEVHEGFKISRANQKFGATRKWLEKALRSVQGNYLKILQIYIEGALMGIESGVIDEMIRDMYFDSQQRSIRRSRPPAEPRTDTKVSDYRDNPPEGSLLARARKITNPE